MMNVKELKGIDVHLKEIDRLIQLSPTRTVDRSQIRNPKEIERHEQMKQFIRPRMLYPSTMSLLNSESV